MTKGKGMTPEEIAEDTAYRRSLLNPEILPKEMSQPEKSVKVVYVPSVGGNVHRQDYDAKGKQLTDILIPDSTLVEVTGEETPDGEKVFLRQNSAYGFINLINRDGVAK